jgi:hypothetical protein
MRLPVPPEAPADGSARPEAADDLVRTAPPSPAGPVAAVELDRLPPPPAVGPPAAAARRVAVPWRFGPYGVPAEQRVVLREMALRLDLEPDRAEPERPQHRNVTMIPARGGRVVLRRRAG